MLGSLMSAGGAARADAIDGNWCGPDDRSLTIAGPQITTPGGTKMRGDYDRHGFSYVVPAREPNAGATVVMALRDEHTVHLRLRTQGAAEDGPVQVWKRCNLST
jgi:hypothetical protein